MSYAGLEPVMRLAESCDLHGLVRERLHVSTDKGSNASGKVATIVAGMLTGADSIDDLDVVRHGGMPMLFGGVYAPSTLGEFLRALTHGHVRQLQAVGREFLVQLARQTPLLPGAGAVTFIDVDSLLRRAYGKKKQGVGFGHAKVGGYKVLLRGYNPLLATISTPDAAPVIAATQLRAGNAGSARGAASLIAEAIATTKAVLAAGPATAGGELVLRADSAFYSRKVIGACRRGGVHFSITIRVDKKVRRAIDSIPADAWVEIEYPQPVCDDQQQRFVSRAQIAEISYTAFENTRDEVTARLIVRRIPDLNTPKPDGQGELFPLWRYHAAFTDSPFVLVQAEEQHRGHAVIEQVFAELIDGPLAHLPSGVFNANNAWLTCMAIAHNLTRAAATLAGRRSATARLTIHMRQTADSAANQIAPPADRASRHAGRVTQRTSAQLQDHVSSEPPKEPLIRGSRLTRFFHE